MDMRTERLEHWQQNIVQEKVAVSTVDHDIRELLCVQTKVQRAQHAACHRDPELTLEVRRMVPHERRYTIGRHDPRQFERASQAARAVVEVAIPAAGDRTVRPARYDLDLTEELAGPLEDGSKRQRKIH